MANKKEDNKLKKIWEKVAKAVQEGAIQKSIEQAATELPKQMFNVATAPARFLVSKSSRDLDKDLRKSIDEYSKKVKTQNLEPSANLVEKYKGWEQTVKEEPMYAERYAQEFSNAWENLKGKAVKPIGEGVKEVQEKFWEKAPEVPVFTPGLMTPEAKKEMEGEKTSFKDAANEFFSVVKLEDTDTQSMERDKFLSKLEENFPNRAQDIMDIFIMAASAEGLPKVPSLPELTRMLNDDPERYTRYKENVLNGLDPLLYYAIMNRGQACMDHALTFLTSGYNAGEATGSDWNDVRAVCGVNSAQPSQPEPTPEKPTPPRPSPEPPETHTCWACGEVAGQRYSIQIPVGIDCPEGTSDTEITCPPPGEGDTVCYKCIDVPTKYGGSYGKLLISRTFNAPACPSGFSPEPITCG